MAALAGIYADVFVTSSPSVGFVDVTMTDSGDHTTYVISDATKRYFDTAGTFTVETSPDGVTWTTALASTYTLQYVGGKVIFNGAEPAGTHVRVSGTYFPYSEAGQAHAWQLDITDDLLDSSTFGSTWKSYTPAQRDAKATVSRYWLDTFFTALLNSGATVVLVLYADTRSGARFEAYAYLAQDTAKSAVSSLVEEELSFTIQGAVFYEPS